MAVGEVVRQPNVRDSGEKFWGRASGNRDVKARENEINLTVTNYRKSKMAVSTK